MTPRPRLQRRRRRRVSRQRGMALVLVLAALTVLAVMLAEFQDETSAELGSALSQRDAVKAEYAARSAVNLSRLLIASEPTIRKGLAPLFLLMKQGPPQIPVWAFADKVLGAFNDDDGKEAFQGLAGLNLAEGENLGMEGAGFAIEIIDEDAKINVNIAARGDDFSKVRLAQQLIGLMAGTQFDPMFEGRDPDGQFTDRQAVCAAIIDWVDPDQDAEPCDPSSTTAQTAGAEDSFYQLLKSPYQRKNAAFDSLQELHLVRGVGDDFWSTFVDPDPSKPNKRVVTVWGQGKVNVNTANPQTVLAVICSQAVPGTPLCVDPNEQSKFLMAVNMMQGFTSGFPLFGSPTAFARTITGKGKNASMIAGVLTALDLKPVSVKSEAELIKSITTESKVFSIYATGIVKAGKRETRVRAHAVVDFRAAPPPGMTPGAANALSALAAAESGQSPQTGETGANPTSGLPEGATESAIASVFQPSPGGDVIYYKLE